VPVPPPATDLPLLVLDDDAALVELTREMLTGLGYPSEGCTDPAEALRRLREVPCRYALLVTDEVMPGLTGTALTEALRTAGGVLPVLLVSGYGGAQLAERAHRAGITRVLAKPLRRAELELALAELLN
jgi:CheY-like chemotaxis protein